jgi:hypothetical protein
MIPAGLRINVTMVVCRSWVRVQVEMMVCMVAGIPKLEPCILKGWEWGLKGFCHWVGRGGGSTTKFCLYISKDHLQLAS